MSSVPGSSSILPSAQNSGDAPKTTANLRSDDEVSKISVKELQAKTSKVMSRLKAQQLKEEQKTSPRQSQSRNHHASQSQTKRNEYTRSMSECVKRTNQIDLNSSTDSKSRRTRRRQSKSNTEDNNASQPLELNISKKMLIELLTMSSEEREKSLISLAVINNIFVVDKKTKFMAVNQRLPFTVEKLEKLNATVNQKNEELQKNSISSEINKLVLDAFPLASSDLLLKHDDIRKNDVPGSLEAYANKLVKEQLGYFVENPIRINSKKCQESYITNFSGKDDIYLDSLRLRMNAMNSDVVRAFVFNKPCKIATDNDNELLPKSRCCSGFVVSILKGAQPRSLVGCVWYSKLNCNHIFFIPRDMKVPRVKVYKSGLPSFVCSEDTPDAENLLYVAQITHWEDTTPVGEILELIGRSNDLSVEQTAILKSNNLSPNNFDSSILNSIHAEVPTDEFKNRLDLRKECIFTIDPATARDLDDAVSCELLSNGNFKVGVHIADVSFFIPEGSELDKLVTKMTSTIYLVDRVFHMLPVPLCNLCSLLPGSDKLAFSVFWELSPVGKIISTDFKRTVINSCAQMAYEHAQQLIEDKDCKLDDLEIHNGFTIDQLAQKIHDLHKIAELLRKEREDNGLLQIYQPKMQFKLDTLTGMPLSYDVHVQKDSHRLIEEFMLLANQSVAKFTYSKFPKLSILRNHRAPDERMLAQLKEFLKKFSFQFDDTDSKSINQSLKKIVSTSIRHADAVSIIINILASKPMKRADYFCSGIENDESAFWHYALSVPFYTHFTSPIRRYPDILVHRVLAAALDLSAPPTASVDAVQAICNTCNVQKYDCKLAGDDSAKFYFTEYIRLNGPLLMEAAVHQVFHKNVDIVLIQNGFHLKLYLNENGSEMTFKISEGSSPLSGLVIFSQTNVPTQLISPFAKINVQVFYFGDKLKAKLIPFNSH